MAGSHSCVNDRNRRGDRLSRKTSYMETTIIGNPDVFAIQYKIEDPWPPHGHASLWIHGTFIGDMRRTIFFYHMCRSLDTILRRDNKSPPVIYRNPDAVPSDEYFFSRPSSSWGDSFDDFFLEIYVVESERRIHFLWELESSRSQQFPDYPLGKHHNWISFEVFDETVAPFLGRKEIACVLRSQRSHDGGEGLCGTG
jgi:hypothetical protein